MASQWNFTSNIWFQLPGHCTLRYDLSDLAFGDVEEGPEDTTLNQKLGWGFAGGGITTAHSLWVCPTGVAPSEASPPGLQIA